MKAPSLRSILALTNNLLLVYVVYALCRIIYWAENMSAFPGFWSQNALVDIIRGALTFDTSAIMYTNVLYAVMMLLPLRMTTGRGWQRAARWVFMVFNSLAVVINLADAAYFPYTGRRTTTTVFTEFANEGNLTSIIGVEMFRHWYLVLAGVALIVLLWKAYRDGSSPRYTSPVWFYLTRIVALAAFAVLCIGGMRGGLSHAVRPITVSNATQYVSRPAEAPVVLNTPFSLLRTIGKNVFATPSYFATPEELEAVYTPVHPSTQLADSLANGTPNVVVLIVESFGREYIGALNPDLEGGTYRGYTPFVDSLIAQSTTFRWSFCNGRKSIDGMPSILSGIPMFVEPFVLTPASMNTVSGLAGELSHRGYTTAFFHGAENGSMGFQAFARKTGFSRYYGRDEFYASPATRGEKDYDGLWAIWDEPFLQYYAHEMSNMQEPFMTAVFTATSHHPFRIPEEYRDTFPEEGIPMHKCIRYTDHALRRFFYTARQQPWFDHTLFVLTSDHTNLSDHDFYQTDIGTFCSPIIFFDPSGRLLQPGIIDAVAQHTDIMPSVLGLLGSERPYVAFGCDLFSTPPDSTWAVNYLTGTYQYVKHQLLLQYDPVADKTRAVYQLSDSLLQNNIVGQRPEQASMERELRAIIQQYMSRMNGDKLVVTAGGE